MSDDVLTRPSDPVQEPSPTRSSWWKQLRPLVLRIHFYAGVLVAPFIFVSALSGCVYAISPALDRIVYSDLLEAADPAALPVGLAEQVEAATVGRDRATLAAVRPAAEPGATTRVMFTDSSLASSEHDAVFVDPGTGQVLGEAVVYGTSGSLPVRTWVSQFHRHLHLGEPGRLYSELAASWLWVLALSGLAMWTARAVQRRRAREIVLARRSSGGRSRAVSVHAVVGTWAAVGLIALSATGLTWSTYAGNNVSKLRNALSWVAPPLERDAAVSTDEPMTSGSDPFAYAAALDAARAVGVDAGAVEVKAPTAAGENWYVREIGQVWPVDLDSAALAVTGSGRSVSAAVTDVNFFADYPLMAKLASWGIYLHMGVLFGWVNQAAVLALGIGLVVMIVLGYRMWWLRGPREASRWRPGGSAPGGALRGMPWWAAGTAVLTAAAVGWFLPLFGLSLLLFVLLDIVFGRRRQLASVTGTAGSFSAPSRGRVVVPPSGPGTPGTTR